LPQRLLSANASDRDRPEAAARASSG